MAPRSTSTESCTSGAFLLKQARDRRVAHIGFTDWPMRNERLLDGTWLHAELARVAAETVGIDSDRDGVEWAKAHGYEAHVVDATDSDAVAALGLRPFDLVIAGEVIEHMDAPGPFLKAMQQLSNRLIITTPNALQPLLTLVRCQERK
jgi:2-polyprenyl-3-methyl-5-hydroxy-6-metoxy-1,4-benzoquinol methylase